MRDGAVARDVSRERRLDLPGARLRHEPIVAPSCILNEVNGADPKRRPDPTRRRVLAAAGVAALTMFAFACAGIIGIDDRLPDDVTDEGGAGIDRFVPDDVVVPPGACPATAKCVVAPDGWVLTSLDPNNRTGCADGYGSPEDVLVTADGLGCTCKCTETSPGSCVGVAGQTTPFRSYPAAGCGNNSTQVNLDLFDGGCDNRSVTVQVSNRVPPAVPTQPGCAADAGPTPLKSGQTCLARGAACAGGGTCAGALPDAGHLCFAKDGDEPCPAGFERKYLVGGSVSADTRKCGTCTCTPEMDCNAPVVTLFADAGCTGATLAIPANGSCFPEEAGVYASYRYVGKAPGCQPSVPPLLDGGVTITKPRTLCCEQRN